MGEGDNKRSIVIYLFERDRVLNRKFEPCKNFSQLLYLIKRRLQ